MANPNLFGAQVLFFETATKLANTSETLVFNAAAGLGVEFKLASFNLINLSGSSTTVSVKYYDEDDLGGTGYYMLRSQTLSPGQIVRLVNWATTGLFYVMEDRSISVTAGNNNAVSVTIAYQGLS